MTYTSREHLHNKEVKVRLDAEYHERLKKIAAKSKTAKQPAAFARMYLETLLEIAEKEGIGAVDEFFEQRLRA